MRKFNRNESKIERINGRKIVSKYHKKLIFLKREELFYETFRNIPLVKTPEIYSIGGLNIKTYFIEEKRKNISLAIQDWAKVHNYFIKNPLEENKLLMKYDINRVSKYLLDHEDIRNLFGKRVEDRLKSVGLNKRIETLLHGDLTPKNFISCNNENYYFDFELGGIGHPARDLASMIISNPRKKERIVNRYKSSFDYDYSSLDEDIDNWTFVRASQLYFIFNKRKGSERQKSKIKDKLIGIIEGIV